MLDEFDIDEIPDDDDFEDDYSGDYGYDEEGGSEPSGGGNRNLLIIGGIVGGVLLLAIACAAIYFLFIRNGGTQDTTAQPEVLTQEAANLAQEATNQVIATQNQMTAEAAISTATAMSFTPTFTVAVATDTPAPDMPTSTPLATLEDVMVDQGGGGTDPTQDPRTATVQALLTQASMAQTQAAETILTVTPTPTALPNTGFMDDFGIPGLFIAVIMLVGVIFVVRRLRAVNA